MFLKEQKGQIGLKWLNNLITACKFTRTRVHREEGLHNTFFQTLQGSVEKI